MTDFVSNRWMGAVAMAAPMSVVAFVFILQGFPWAGLVWLSLAFPAVLSTLRATPAPAVLRRSARSGRVSRGRSAEMKRVPEVL
jgi:hypothetical protein